MRQENHLEFRVSLGYAAACTLEGDLNFKRNRNSHASVLRSLRPGCSTDTSLAAAKPYPSFFNSNN